MLSEELFTLTVAFSLVAGSAAGLLSLLTWETLRRSPFGRAVLVLSAVMVLFIVYHAVLLVFRQPPPVTSLFKSVLFTGIALFIWLLVLNQRRLRSAPGDRP